MIISMTAVIPNAIAPIIRMVGSPDGGVILGMELLLMVGIIMVGLVMAGVLLCCTVEGSGPPTEKWHEEYFVYSYYLCV